MCDKARFPLSACIVWQQSCTSLRLVARCCICLRLVADAEDPGSFEVARFGVSPKDCIAVCIDVFVCAQMFVCTTPAVQLRPAQHLAVQRSGMHR